MTQFDLEQAIMRAWCIVEDIQLLRQIIEHFKLQPKEYDSLDNYLLGLETIYHKKFENLFSLFEKLIWEKNNGD